MAVLTWRKRLSHGRRLRRGFGNSPLAATAETIRDRYVVLESIQERRPH